MAFLKFFLQLREILILMFCILCSTFLLIFNDNDPDAPFRIVAINLIGSIGESVQAGSDYFRLTNKVEELRKENAELALKNTQMEDAMLENIRLREMLEFKEQAIWRLVPVKVIGQNPLSILNGFLLNEGSTKNIIKSDAVINSEGLVGKIIDVNEDFSICQILLDRNSKVSAKIQRNRELGIISWDGGARLKLLYVAKTIKVLIGDVVISSGYSQIFPENIKIGVVVNVSLDTDDLFQEIIVQPSVNFSRVEEVFIMKGGNKIAD